MERAPSPDQHMAAARRRLGHLAALDSSTDEAERKIRDAAMKRLAVVDEDLAKARPRAILHDGAGDAYLALTSERARLLNVIDRANTLLGSADEASP
ncbi:hypothetical protein EOD42_22520 [Rhodovarius crocodyli]|uniref:Uncharacterized protein n=1 Tax=Rhodovarius crocodyli TaxID=1979269 RepID=A0A437M1M2_9PROT|nr:hypothetical protein [Rhodovarius crocodyli]RVT91433.1 hypothetical protein EOD42_22520 [Rhodovarius crocodyli]